MSSNEKPRVIINCATTDLTTFTHIAEAASAIGEDYDLRLTVNHLVRRDDGKRTNPADPYLQYSVGFPSVRQFVPDLFPEDDVDPAFLAENRELMAAKLAVLKEHGMGGAFFGCEPSYFPEALFVARPHWRGPRVDQPQRSLKPLYSLCLHQPEVQTLYHTAFERLAADFPGLDTFYWWSNDSGSGYCWYPHLYPGANGPAACQQEGPFKAMTAFHEAVLGGARSGGAAQAQSIQLHSRIWDARQMPGGAFALMESPGDETVRSIRSDLSATYPIRFLWDPVERLLHFGQAQLIQPKVLLCWLSDVYHRGHADPETVRRYFTLWAMAAKEPESTRRLADRLGLLTRFAAAEYGERAAADVVEAWNAFHDAMVLQRNHPFPKLSRQIPTYGPVSHRWLTRPMVPLPGRLSPEEESEFLPHVFALGDEARRSNLLEIHGYQIADDHEEPTLRSRYIGRIVDRLLDMAVSLDTAAGKAVGPVAEDLFRSARAARLLSCVWRNISHWCEFALQVARGTEGAFDPNARINPEVRVYRETLHGLMRREIDNIEHFQELLGDDPEGLVVRGQSADQEDTFTFSSRLQEQLSGKRRTMFRRWLDVERMVPIQRNQTG